MGACLAILAIWMVWSQGAGAAPNQRQELTVASEAVRGQVVVFHANAPAARSVQFSFADKERLDSEPPFSASFDTDDLQPGPYSVKTVVGIDIPNVELGGANLSQHCQSHGFEEVVLVGPVEGPDAAYGWHCKSGSNLTPVDFTAACRSQYGTDSAVARTTNPSDAFSWRCYRPSPGSVGGPSGEVQIFPVAKVRKFKASALIVSGTRRMVGLFVSNVERGDVVRAWFATSSIDSARIPLVLRNSRGSTRTYRFGRGLVLSAKENSLLDIEVAPPPLTMSHGAEVQGRLALLWLRENSAGETLAHQSRHSYCTVWRGRSASSDFEPLRRGDCLTAPSQPAVSIDLLG